MRKLKPRFFKTVHRVGATAVPALAAWASAVLFVASTVVAGGSALKEEPSFNDLRNLPRIPPAQLDEILGAFGARQHNNGKVTFRSRAPGGQAAVKSNLLFLYGVGPDYRAKMYEKSSCGARGYQLIYIKTKKEGEVHGVVYNCKNECLSMREFVENGKLKGVSRPVSLPEAFCDGLWSGMIKVIDEHGL